MTQTRSRAARIREVPEVAAAARRMVRATGQRVANADSEDLQHLVDLAAAVTEATQAAVDGLRAQGHSWAYIANGLGITRQAAQQRFGRGA